MIVFAFLLHTIVYSMFRIIIREQFIFLAIFDMRLELGCECVFNRLHLYEAYLYVE